MPKPEEETFDCPNCGAAVRVGAAACPECGSDEETGWSDETQYDDLDLPDPPESGYGREERDPPRSKAAFWKAVAVLILVLLTVLLAMGVW